MKCAHAEKRIDKAAKPMGAHKKEKSTTMANG
jgi:hypothetical protein